MNKTAVITGGSDGVGKALALNLGENGFNVITCGRSQRKLSELANDFTGKTELTTFCGDLTDEKDFESFISLIDSATKTVDILINNAGIQIENELLENANIEAINEMQKIHMIVPLKLYQKIFPMMKDKKQGMIMNIVSVVVKGYLKETYGPYTTTKYSQYGLSQMMLKEASKYNVKVTNVILGGANTNIRESERPEYLKPSDVAEH